MAESYKGWRIIADEIIARWEAYSPDYAASYEGPEDGWVTEGDMLFADTLKDLMQQIDDWEADNA